MREDGVEVLIVAPESPEDLQGYLERHAMSFRAIADPSCSVLKALGQQSVWWKLGRMPGLLAVDSQGQVVVRHEGRSMRDLPDFEGALAELVSASTSS